MWRQELVPTGRQRKWPSFRIEFNKRVLCSHRIIEQWSFTETKCFGGVPWRPHQEITSARHWLSMESHIAVNLDKSRSAMRRGSRVSNYNLHVSTAWINKHCPFVS